jgi:hypothetical protein
MPDPLSKNDKDMLFTIGIGTLGILLVAIVASGTFQVLGMCGIAIATIGVLLHAGN